MANKLLQTSSMMEKRVLLFILALPHSQVCYSKCSFLLNSSRNVLGIATGTCTNPIWVVKTRMQLSASESRPFTSAAACVNHILRTEGFFGLYKGLSASYLGVSEGIIQWTLYEQLKRLAKRGEGGPLEWVGMLGAAGAAKTVASLITYPHEVSSYHPTILIANSYDYRS